MEYENLDQKWFYFHCSSSIENWKDKIEKRYGLKEYIWWRDWKKPVIFFGLYNPVDYVKFFLHRGKKIVHWCGSDILQVGWMSRWIRRIRAKHICETEVERGVLQVLLQQDIEVKPTFLSNVDEFEVSYKQSKNPKVYIHINRNAERESGLEIIKRIAPLVPDVTFHIFGRMEWQVLPLNVVRRGYVPENEFNEEIKNYQAGLDFHVFSGFSEIIAKSILMGQYPIAYVRYPLVDSFHNEKELIALLQNLSNKKEPNYQVRDYYLKQFYES